MEYRERAEVKALLSIGSRVIRVGDRVLIELNEDVEGGKVVFKECFLLFLTHFA